jgi:hypothetical protein
MAKLIKLKEGLFVAADEVRSIQTIEHRDGLRVYMKDGSDHWVPNDYGKSEWSTQERLVNLVNEALSNG